MKVRKNVLITEFMGYKVNQKGIILSAPLNDNSDTDDEILGRDVNVLGFHTSYDALIPVLKKIYQIMISWNVPNYIGCTGYNYWDSIFISHILDFPMLRDSIVDWINFYNKIPKV